MKRRINAAIDRAVRAEIGRRDPLIAQIPRQRIHEGRAFSVLRESGDQSRTEFVEARSESTIDLFAALEMGAQDALDMLDEVIDDICHQQGLQMVKTLEQDVPQMARVKGETDAETHLRMLRQISMAFDRRGRPVLPSLLMHPDLARRVRPELERAWMDPDYQNQLQDIIAMKREEWRAIEASRRLAD